MHFKFLTEVGAHYADESATHLMEDEPAAGAAGPGQPLRRVVLVSLAAAVLRAKTQYEQLDAQHRAQHGGGVHATKVSVGIQAKAAALLQAGGGAPRYTAGMSPAAAVSAEAVARARGVYDAALRHFQNQGGAVNDDGTLNWAGSDQLVVYDRTAAAQNLTRLRIKNGLLYTDDAAQNPFDTTNMSTVFSKLGYAIYVMSEEGNLHADTHAIGYRHHSSLLAAANASGAGEMKVEKGVLKWISNKSGHYTPAVQHFVQVLHLLQKKGIDLGGVAVQFHTRAAKTPYATVGDFLAALNPEQEYHHAKMIGYVNSRPYPEIDAMIRRKNWRFPTSDEYNRFNLKGVIDAGTGQVIPHKQVCHYFKEEGVAFNPTVQLDRLGDPINPARLQAGAGR